MSLSSEEGINSKYLNVKLFSFSSELVLEGELNSWLNSNTFAIRDVIYQHSISSEDASYSCMVIYTHP